MSKGKIDILTLEETLEVLANWNVRHKYQLRSNGALLEGIANPYNRTIEISDNSFHSSKLYTLIHELIHASDMNRGYDSKEKHTEQRTEANYLRLYGNRFLRN